MDRKKKIMLLVVIGWVLSVAVIVGVVIGIKYKRHKIENKREVKASEMVDQIKGGQESFRVDPNALPVSGEEIDDEVDGEDVEETLDLKLTFELPDIDETEETDEDQQQYNENSGYDLISYGTISIPSIDCDIPLWNGAGKIELRYGAGRMPLSCDAGENGNLVIYGHRMRRYGSMFNRLGEVQIGDSIVITRTDGSSYTYIVDQIETIEPSQITRYIEVEDSGARITLITCTPTGVGSHRLLVIGHLS